MSAWSPMGSADGAVGTGIPGAVHDEATLKKHKMEKQVMTLQAR